MTEHLLADLGPGHANTRTLRFSSRKMTGAVIVANSRLVMRWHKVLAVAQQDSPFNAVLASAPWLLARLQLGEST